MTTMTPRHSLEALEARFALRVAARLTQGTQDVGADVGERLRFARERALVRAQAQRTAAVARPQASVLGGAVAVLGRHGGAFGWLSRLALGLPLVVLVGGLVLIQQLHNDAQIDAAAEVDAALLADDVPPNAYSDVGFVEFLKTPGE